MTMLLQPPLPVREVTPPVAEQRLLLHDISWQAYELIGEALRDRGGIRLTYDRGRLEIMTTSPEHEQYKERLGDLLKALAEECGREILPLGNMTFKPRPQERGLEPDQCFWIAHERAMRAKRTWEPALDPPPDLFIEIEITRSFLDRMDICATIGVPEVWCFDGEQLRVLLLQPDRTFQVSASSPTFPGIALAGIMAFMQPSESQGYLETIRALRAWVREQLLIK